MNNTRAELDSKRNKQYEQLLQKQQLLMEMGKEFTIEVVNGNYSLISDLFNAKTFRKSEYTVDELRFVKEVRRHIVKNEVYLQPQFQENQVFSEDVHYVRVARVPMGKTFKNICEVDIDQAYWETAYQLGIIPEKLYVKGCKGNISKKCRLTALGSLARKKYKYTYKGDKLVDQIVDREPLLENLWFTICKRVSDVMHEVIDALGKDFVFYWVDGIYFDNTPKNVTKVMSVFLNWGYNTKFKKINQIQFHETGFTVNDYGTIKREFTYPNYSKKGKKVDYAENFKLAQFANKVVNDEIDLVDEIKKEFKDKDDKDGSKES
jgi:hypothetical protein